MIALHVFLNAEEMLLDLPQGTKLVELDKELRIGVLEGGTIEGNPTVSICFPLPQGGYAFAETSLRLFLAAARVFAARYGWQDDRP
jgi:hypothetical protein